MKSFLVVLIMFFATVSGHAIQTKLCTMTGHDTVENVYAESEAFANLDSNGNTKLMISLHLKPSLSNPGVYGFVYDNSVGEMAGFLKYREGKSVYRFSPGTQFTPSTLKGKIFKEKYKEVEPDLFAEYLVPLSEKEYYERCGCPDQSCRCSLDAPYRLKLTVSCK
jgi:hypothetical protein